MGSTRELSDCFRAERAEDFFEAYRQYAETRRGWEVPYKMKMYLLAEAANRAGASGEQRRGAFKEISDELRRFWQVFRRAETKWTDEEIADRLEGLRPSVGWDSGVSLRGLSRGTDVQAVVDSIVAMRHIKRTTGAWQSPMAASKHLHFLNPALFPIYDTAVIENEVFKAFQHEWRNFEPTIAIASSVIHIESMYYFKYVLWAASLLLPDGDAVIDRFVDWLGRKYGSDDIVGRTVHLQGKLDALVVEVVLIGAAHRKQSA